MRVRGTELSEAAGPPAARALGPRVTERHRAETSASVGRAMPLSSSIFLSLYVTAESRDGMRKVGEILGFQPFYMSNFGLNES